MQMKDKHCSSQWQSVIYLNHTVCVWRLWSMVSVRSWPVCSIPSSDNSCGMSYHRNWKLTRQDGSKQRLASSPISTYPHISTWSLHSQRASRAPPRLSRRILDESNHVSYCPWRFGSPILGWGSVDDLLALKIFTAGFVLFARRDLRVIAKFALNRRSVCQKQSLSITIDAPTSRWAQTWQHPHLSKVNPARHSLSEVWKRQGQQSIRSLRDRTYHWTFGLIAGLAWFDLSSRCRIEDSESN